MICDGALSGYPEENGLRIVPEDDLTAAGNARLGTSRQPEYKTIGFTDDIRFYYDEPKKSWILPESPQWFGREPVIREMYSENGGYTVEADPSARIAVSNKSMALVCPTITEPIC